MNLSSITAFYRRHKRHLSRRTVYRKYANYTMVPEDVFIDNLELASSVRDVAGAVVECGVWRGGMIAGLAEILGPNRTFVLCDSFQGLPKVRGIDGPAAMRWQKDISGPWYHNNCSVPEAIAREAMQLSPARNVQYVAGWFHETLPNLGLSEPIAVLRLDADWYDSTMTCLTALFDRVTVGGIILIDDYYVWDGCSRAVHDFLAKRQLDVRIRQWNGTLCYIRIDPSE